MTTLYRRIDDPAELANPNVVKVVLDRGGLRAVFLARADSVRARSARRLAAALPAHRPLRLPAQRAARARGARADAARARRVARAAAGARARHPDQGGRDRVRLDRRRHAGRISSRCAGCWRRRRRTSDVASGSNVDSRQVGGHTHDRNQVHLRDRRRGFLARQGAGGGLDRRAARGPRLQGHAAEVRPLHQRRSGHDEPVPARRGLRHRRRRARPTSTSATTSASPTR